MAHKDLSKKFKGSPYDASGMPLGCETVDNDKKEDVAAKTVKSKVVEPVNVADIDFDHSVTEADWQKRTKYNPVLNNTAIQTPGHAVYKKHADDLGVGITELKDPPKKVDLGNEDDKRKAIVEDSEEKGIAVPELPKVAKKEEVKDIKATAKGIKSEEKVGPDQDPEFLKALKDAK